MLGWNGEVSVRQPQWSSEVGRNSGRGGVTEDIGVCRLEHVWVLEGFELIEKGSYGDRSER